VRWVAEQPWAAGSPAGLNRAFAAVYAAGRLAKKFNVPPFQQAELSDALLECQRAHLEHVAQQTSDRGARGEGARRDQERGEQDHADDNADEQQGECSRPWWEVLKVDRSASGEAIKAAWIAGLKAYHPDKVNALGPKLRAVAERETKALNAAYEAAQRRQSD